VLSVVKEATNRRELQFQALQAAAKTIGKLSLENTPAENSYYVLKAAQKVLMDDDPFSRKKLKYNKIALKMYPRLKRIIKRSHKPLYTAIKIALAGNIIDMGILPSFDIERTLKEVLNSPLTIDDFDKFSQELEKNPKIILYLGDNTGEIVFDKLVVEELLPKKVFFAVKSGPILNDATLPDARLVKMGEVARMITTGTDMLGAPLKQCSKEFQDIFQSADLIISKGHANYETLSEVKANIYFLLKAKCEAVARDLGVRCGDLVFKKGESGSRNL
jgi:hypothetical protein